MELHIEILEGALHLAERLNSASGGVVRFSGVVRGEEDGQHIPGLHYEAYQPMAEKMIRQILEELAKDSPIKTARVLHRIGFVPVGAAAIIVEVHSVHRREALDVVARFMDRLKAEVPIWKVSGLSAPAESSPAPKSRDVEISATWQMIDEHVTQLAAKRVPILDAVGQVASDAVLSKLHLPPFDQSAMDGYAFAEVVPGECRVLCGELAAGDAPSVTVKSGEAIRIFTGAPVPDGAVCVARQEDCVLNNDGMVSLNSGVVLELGQHIREKGGSCREGDLVLPESSLISPGSVALLVSAGHDDIEVICRAKVQHIVTGKELVSSDEEVSAGKIRDSNGPMIEALLRTQGIVPLRSQIGDDLAELSASVQAFDGDLLLISGGSGPGDHDHSRRALEDAGFAIHFSRVNSRPGRPLIFATRGSQVAFGLPGNPLSHFVCYHVFVRRALARLHGEIPPDFVKAKLLGDMRKDEDSRPTWTPCVIKNLDGGLAVSPIPWKHSGDLTPLVMANALILGGADGEGFARAIYL